MKILTSLVLSGVAIIALSGCGGSGGSDSSGGSDEVKTVTGVFRDANVAGLNYACSSGKKDFTTDDGEYTCNVGDTVEFSLGTYILGTVTATSGVVTPMELYPNDIEAATNVLQLLQTIDSGADGTIKIPDNFSKLNDVTTKPSDSAFDDVMEAELGKPLVSEENAQEHMLRTLLEDKTLYTTIYDEMGTMESWSFNSDVTAANWVEMVGGSDRGSVAIVLDGMAMTMTCTSDSGGACESGESVATVKNILTDYLEIEVTGGELGSEIEELRLYFDESKAREYLLSIAPNPVGDIVGIWLTDCYPDGPNKYYNEKVVFNKDGTGNYQQPTYDKEGCNPEDILKNNNSKFNYTVGKLVKALDGKDAVELDSIDDSGESYYQMFRLDLDKLWLSDGDGDSPEKRANDFSNINPFLKQ